MKKTILIIIPLLFNQINAENLYTHKLGAGLLSNVSAPSGSTKFSCSTYHCIALKNGNVWTIGWNNYGELGLGNTTSVTEWTDTGVEATDVKVMSTYSSAIIKDGNLWVTGRNHQGQLGIGNTTNQLSFIDTGKEINNINQVSGGSFYSMFLDNGGIVWTTGNNYNGKLGLGNTIQQNQWKNTGKSADFIFASGQTSYYIKNGEIFGAGGSTRGQLGNGLIGSGVYRTNFISTGITDVEDMKAGYYFAVARKNDNTLWTIGDNDYGQLGIGNNTDRSIWTNTGEIVSSKNNYSTGYGTLHIQKNGTIWSTGFNTTGQLGIGNTSNQNDFVDTSFVGDLDERNSNSATHTLEVLKDGKRYVSGSPTPYDGGGSTLRESVLP